MLYLLDANVLIRAHGDYYPIDRVPPFWDWLICEGNDGHTKIPFEIYDEIANGNDLLAQWVKEKDTRDAFVLDEEVDGALSGYFR